MTNPRALMLVAALALAEPGWAADTDVENPALRELPLQRGPIIDGHKHQPTPAEIQERAQEREQERKAAVNPSSEPPATSAAENSAAASARDDLYQRVLQQSRHGMPTAIDPDQ